MKSCAAASLAAWIDLPVGGTGPAAGDVLADGVVQDQGLLGQQRDVLAQEGHRAASQGDAVEADLPFRGVVEAQQQFGDASTCRRRSVR